VTDVVTVMTTRILGVPDALEMVTFRNNCAADDTTLWSCSSHASL